MENTVNAGPVTKIRITAPSFPAAWLQDFERISSIIRVRIEERCSARVVNDPLGLEIILSMDENIPEEGFGIEAEEGRITIRGRSPLGILYGAGKLLHTSGYSDDGFLPSGWHGVSVPDSKVRGIYFASHFYNWYHVASEEEIARYMEDMALWGMNSVLLVFPIVNLPCWEDDAAEQCFRQLVKYYTLAKRLNLKAGLLVCPNQDFQCFRQEYRAVENPDPLSRRGNLGNNICPSKPGATDYITGILEEAFRKLEGISLDYLCFWPYDEGGCACEKCFPWGSNGFLKLSEHLASVARRYFGDIRVILSTWMFDTPYEGEWEGIAAQLSRKESRVQYILADAHEDFPRYPLEHPVPGGVPLLNFPEISMWGLWPWGGYGANPLPERFERLWEQVRHIVRGGFPYSEGIFEDINKVVVTQFYWGAWRKAEETLREYISYEYSNRVVPEVLDIIRRVEDNHTRAAAGQKIDPVSAEKAYETAVRVDAELAERARKSWRWRILYLRTLLDRQRYRRAAEYGGILPEGKNWGQLLEGDPDSENAMRELIGIYHSRLKPKPGEHHMSVRPPLKL